MSDPFTRFDSFTNESYKTAYKGDSELYQRLYSMIDQDLDKYESMIEIGCGPNAPAAHHLQSVLKKPFRYTLVEPSQAAKELEAFAKEIKSPSTIQILQKPADAPEVKALPKHDLVISNRMIHEWKLYEQASGHEWTVKSALELLISLCSPKGAVILCDFCYHPDYAKLPEDNPELKADMERLRVRIGHTHPPKDYITLDEVQKAAEELGLSVSSFVLERPELDTHRIYWMTKITCK